jgi:hypothetical protein
MVDLFRTGGSEGHNVMVTGIIFLKRDISVKRSKRFLNAGNQQIKDGKPDAMKRDNVRSIRECHIFRRLNFWGNAV